MRTDTEKVARIPAPLNIYSLILNSDHLHFGYWPEDKPELSLEQAQEVMFAKLEGLLPKQPVKILDVGCGLGFSAFLLARKGYEVCAIAPSQELIDYARNHYVSEGIEFWVADFMDQKLAERQKGQFDVLFFQESLQYLHPLEEVFENASLYLKHNGRLIISDEMSRDRDLRNKTSVYCVHDVIIMLSEHKYAIKSIDSVGKNVEKTCAEILSRIDEHQKDILSVIDDKDIKTSIRDLLVGWGHQQEWYASRKFDYILLSAVKDDISMQAYAQGDEQKILSLFHQVFHSDRTLEQWNWEFLYNPFGKLNIALAKSPDQEIAAHFSAYPVPMYWQDHPDGQVFLTAQAGDTMTNPAYRGRGLGKTSVLSRLARYFFSKFCFDQYPFIYGFNTGNIKKFGQRYLGYEYIRPVPYIVLNREDKSELGRLSFKDKIFISVHREHKAHQELDTFFNTVCTDYQMLIKRDSRYLQWRYFDCPDVDYYFFSIRKLGKIIGWMVFVHKGKKLIWGDSLFQRKHTKYVKYTLGYIWNHYFQDVQTIEGWCSPHPDWWFQALRDVGFQVVSEPNDLTPCFKIFDRSFSVQIFEQQLYYTLGDSDLF
jgi:SAM-dependent methyltransferase